MKQPLQVLPLRRRFLQPHLLLMVLLLFAAVGDVPVAANDAVVAAVPVVSDVAVIAAPETFLTFSGCYCRVSKGHVLKLSISDS